VSSSDHVVSNERKLNSELERMWKEPLLYMDIVDYCYIVGYGYIVKG
jgi:hypothetical protein